MLKTTEKAGQGPCEGRVQPGLLIYPCGAAKYQVLPDTMAGEEYPRKSVISDRSVLFEGP